MHTESYDATSKVDSWCGRFLARDRLSIHYTAPMKSFREYLWMELSTRRGFVNLTPRIEDLVRKSRILEGLCLVNAMHISASVFINDNEPGLLHDWEAWLEKLAPQE